MKRYCFYLVAFAFVLNPAFGFADEINTAQTTGAITDNPTAFDSRIIVKLKVKPLDSDRLALRVSFYNPYRCTWSGHLFLEHEDHEGNTHTIVRKYHTEISGGTRIGGFIVIPRPDDVDTHSFVARAYAPDGSDQEDYVSIDDGTSDNEGPPPNDNGSELVLSNKVIQSSFNIKIKEDYSDLIDQSACDDGSNATPAPIDVRLFLKPYDRVIKVKTVWKNGSLSAWKGDLYIDVNRFGKRLKIIRRDLDARMSAGTGFCTFDRTRLPETGVYRFTARALRRDGSAEVTWQNPGATEINAVCNGEICELIEPDQNRAGIYLKGRSMIRLESDFFSEFTRVTMEYLTPSTDPSLYRSVDITKFCEIRQQWIGAKNQIEVNFNTFRLPIGPETWANYTIELHPMPIAPDGAKTADSLWVLTHGGELTDMVGLE